MQKPLVFEIEDLGWGGCHFRNDVFPDEFLFL